jgi:hypothetical protein
MAPWRARIELRPDKRLLVFGQVSSGFVPAGSMSCRGSTRRWRLSRRPADKWEGVGASACSGDRLRFDVAAYHQLWSRMQYAATTDGAYSFITNIGRRGSMAAKSRSTGSRGGICWRGWMRR